MGGIGGGCTMTRLSRVRYVLSDLHLPPWVTDAADMIIAIRLFQAEASTGCEV